MKILLRYLSQLCSAMMEISSELKQIREIMSNDAFEDMALTAKQAAEILNCSESKVNCLLSKGIIQKKTIKGKRGFSLKELKSL